MKCEISPGEAVSLLESEPRRQVVTLLLEVEREWEVQALAVELVRLTAATATESTDFDRRAERLATNLYHCDLPKLAEDNVVDLDHDAMTVTPAANLATLGGHLDDFLDIPRGVGEEGTSVAKAD